MTEKPPFMALDLAAPNIRRTDHADGSFILESAEPLGPYPDHLGLDLETQAKLNPGTVFLAERDAAGAWQTLTYAQAWEQARRIAAAFLARGMDQDAPVVILSGNSINHALVTLGAHVAGVPVAPVSVAYSLVSQDLGKLKHIISLVKPRVVYADRAAVFAQALSHPVMQGAELVAAEPAAIGPPVTPLSDLLRTEPDAATEARFRAVRPDWIAKLLFTSGSTGVPKGVITTHRMISSNQQAVTQVWPFLRHTPPRLLEWLPWNHAFGANHNFNMVLRHGGTIYVDEGKPLPGLIEKTVANLREVSPNIYFNAPAGYAMLVPFLERDEDLCRAFFKNMKLIFYAAAALPPDLWARLEALSIRTLGRRVMMTSSWGATETAPVVTSAHFPIEQAGVVGVPVPGVRLKFLPSGSKLEMRVAGPNVTPGYLGAAELTRAAFDEDGFYRIGDAGRLADPADPNRGVVFDGRTAEDFKLTTGSWVHVGALRVAALAACSPLLQDAVVTGHDRAYIGLMAWPSAAAKEMPLPALRSALAAKLAAYNAAHGGQSMQVRRLLLLDEPASMDTNENTDKGYINQRAVLERRAHLVERLYAEPPHADVIVAA